MNQPKSLKRSIASVDEEPSSPTAKKKLKAEDNNNNNFSTKASPTPSTVIADAAAGCLNSDVATSASLATDQRSMAKISTGAPAVAKSSFYTRRNSSTGGILRPIMKVTKHRINNSNYFKKGGVEGEDSSQETKAVTNESNSSFEYTTKSITQRDHNTGRVIPEPTISIAKQVSINRSQHRAVQLLILLASFAFQMHLFHYLLLSITRPIYTGCNGQMIGRHLLRLRGSKEGTSFPVSNMTLRDYLSDDRGYYVAMGPAFFGFYAYFGVLSALDDADLLHCSNDESSTSCNVKGVSGASAGAMAATLIASGRSPLDAIKFACNIDVMDFADPPGFLAAFQGEKFEALLNEFLTGATKPTSYKISENMNSGKRRLLDTRTSEEVVTQEETMKAQHSLLQDAIFPVAVSAFDLIRMELKILNRGSMARASRASATFPGLFQPVVWWEEDEEESAPTFRLPSLLVDGGIGDALGLRGLAALDGSNANHKRVLHVLVGEPAFGQDPPGPSDMAFHGVEGVESTVTISLVNTPRCGPWAMENGPKAVKAARDAIKQVMDQQMLAGREDGHYILVVDAKNI